MSFFRTAAIGAVAALALATAPMTQASARGFHHGGGPILGLAAAVGIAAAAIVTAPFAIANAAVQPVYAPPVYAPPPPPAYYPPPAYAYPPPYAYPPGYYYQR